ncbi:hypothetical protein [Paenibacillus sp. DMB5]|uniref:hypothetical protein n=1 Tax=Paenibacillus sp. DMB5 TaxID=1780103 RepID=UPI00076DBBBC|nr:hypothetical protein [Paenibacillus sp. DMB5]KUP22716.1 hypothetical protein AWJ19_25385 [Paenibacillus sp. DMB5]
MSGVGNPKMRYSPKSWAWTRVPAYTAGSAAEASAAAKEARQEEDLALMKGRSRGLLPRT